MFSPWAGGMDATTPELCDIDADGDLDYFSGSENNYYWCFKNTGSAVNPQFQYFTSNFDPIFPVCPGDAYESDIDFCDIDNDGDYDAFLCNGCIGLAINHGNSYQHSFSPPFDTLRDQNNDFLWATNMAIADIDDDGDYDLFGGTYYAGEIRFFENIGTPNNCDFFLVTQTWQQIQVSGGKADPCFGDLDADGDLDLLVGTGEGKIYYYRNDSTSQVPQMVYVTNNFCGIDVGEDASPELADIDGDGDLDLLVGRDALYYETPFVQGDVFFYENIGTPQNYSFQRVTTNYLTFDNINFNRPNLLDIDIDGDPDLFTSAGNNILFYRNQGTINNPSFVYETSDFGGVTVPSISTWFCDIDGDGDYDLFCGTAAIPGPPGLYLFINQGPPQNPSYTLYSNNVVPGVFTQSSAIIIPGTADIDGDGDLDLFSGRDYSTSERNLSFYRNNGNPQNPSLVLEQQFMFPEYYITNAAPYIIDIDGDRDGDLFVGDGYGGIRFFRNMEEENAHATVVTASISGNDIILQWQEVAEADAYKIYYQSNPYFTPSGTPQAVVLPPDTVWTDVNALLEEQKYYRVVVEY